MGAAFYGCTCAQGWRGTGPCLCGPHLACVPASRTDRLQAAVLAAIHGGSADLLPVDDCQIPTVISPRPWPTPCRYELTHTKKTNPPHRMYTGWGGLVLSSCSMPFGIDMAAGTQTH